MKKLTFTMNRRKIGFDGMVIPEKGAYLIFGDNGSGKTTLVRCLTGILKVPAGKIFLDGKDIASLDRLETATILSYLPQTSDMETDISVGDFIRQGLYAAKKGFLDETVKILDLKRYLGRNFGELSGGEKQLARIARAMIPDVRYTFLDEPDSFLSRRNNDRFMELTARFSRRRCIVIVSHDELKFRPRLKPLLELGN